MIVYSYKEKSILVSLSQIIMTAKMYNVLDRIEQTFTLFLKNPLVYILPLALLNIFALVIIPDVFMALFWDIILAQNRASTAIIIIIMIWGIYAIAYLTLIIPTTLLIIKNAVDASQKQEIDVRKNISYSFENIWNSFSMYWYIFRYVYLVPALVFIAGWFLMLFWMITNNQMLLNISYAIMVLAGVYALIQWIYRGVKTKFSLYSAVYNNDFSKERFSSSIAITQWKWWRVVWNFFVAWMIAGLVVWLINWLINSIWFMWTDYSGMLWNMGDESLSRQESLESIMESYTSFSILGFIKSFLSVITNSQSRAYTMETAS